MKKLNKKSVSGLELVSKAHFMHSFSHENCPYYVMLNAIWCHLYNLKNMEKFLGSALLLVKLQIKVTLLRGCFSRLLICTKVQNQATHLMILYQLTKFQYPENKVSFFGETKGIFHIFCSAFFW